MPRTTLTEARVKALMPRKSVRDVRDGKLTGFGVRVSPSGRKRFFIHCQRRGERIWKIVGDAGIVSVPEARSRAGEMLAAHVHRHPPQVAVIRLLLLTGCRKGEILTLRWSDCRDGHLFLRDSKTGPRTVWLSEPARIVLDALERKSRWVFPASRGDRPRSAQWLDSFWCRVREEADLGDVRLHDLRHSYASLALRQGETVLAIGRLLGHRKAETTLKYIHLADAMVRDAVETVGAALGG